MKCAIAKRLMEENEQLREELRQICHENQMLWQYRTAAQRIGESAAQTEKECLDWQISEYDLHVKELEQELDKAIDIAATLVATIKRLVREERKEESHEDV